MVPVGGVVDDKEGKTMREMFSSPQTGRRLRGGKVTCRREI